jgi:hypothetical protein
VSVIDQAKEIAGLIKKIGDIELYRKIIELEGEIIELTRSKRELEDAKSDLEKQLTLKRSMIFKTPFYFQEADGIPFCPRCWEKENKTVHLLILPGGKDFQVANEAFCSACGGEWFKVTNGGWGFKPQRINYKA